MKPPPHLPRGRHRLEAGDVARNQRERILYATVQAIYQYTYAGTTVKDIIAYAGVSKRAFYQHFRDRQQAATEAIEVLFEHAMTATARAFFAASDWPQQIWAGVEAMTSFVAANPAAARSGFVEFHAISPAAIHLVYDRLNAWTLFLEEGYTYSGQNPELPRSCSEVLAAVAFEYSYRAARRPRAGAELPTMLPVFSYLCLAPFLRPNQAADFVHTRLRDLQHTTRGGGDV
jgi:AcrR family transcriptional regulator